MYPLLSYQFFVLDKRNLDIIFQDILKLRDSFNKDDEIFLGIHLEGLKNIRQDIFSFLKDFCNAYKIKLIIFDIPIHLRLNFYLENIPIKIGCAFIE